MIEFLIGLLLFGFILAVKTIPGMREKARRDRIRQYIASNLPDPKEVTPWWKTWREKLPSFSINIGNWILWVVFIVCLLAVLGWIWEAHLSATVSPSTREAIHHTFSEIPTSILVAFVALVISVSILFRRRQRTRKQDGVTLTEKEQRGVVHYRKLREVNNLRGMQKRWASICKLIGGGAILGVIVFGILDESMLRAYISWLGNTHLNPHAMEHIEMYALALIIVGVLLASDILWPKEDTFWRSNGSPYGTTFLFAGIALAFIWWTEVTFSALMVAIGILIAFGILMSEARPVGIAGILIGFFLLSPLFV